MKKDWPWVALAGIAVGSFFLFHPASPASVTKKAPARQGDRRGPGARGRERYANPDQNFDGGAS